MAVGGRRAAERCSGSLGAPTSGGARRGSDSKLTPCENGVRAVVRWPRDCDGGGGGRCDVGEGFQVAERLQGPVGLTFMRNRSNNILINH